MHAFLSKKSAAISLLACLSGLACEPSAPPYEARASARVTLGYIHHHKEPLAATGEWTARAPDGSEAILDVFALVISDIELHACAPHSAQSSFLLDALIPPAFAHVPNSATRLGTPFVEDLLAQPGKARITGEIAPPPGTYCALWAIIAPADEDVMNMTALETQELEGKSALIRGRWRAHPQAPWESFEHAFTTRRAIRVPLSALSLKDGSTAFLLLDKSVALPGSITPAALAEEQAAAQLLEGVLRQLVLFQAGTKKPH